MKCMYYKIEIHEEPEFCLDCGFLFMVYGV